MRPNLREDTEPFETDDQRPHHHHDPAYRVTASNSIQHPVPTPVWSDVEIPSPSLPLSPPSLVLSPAPPPSPIRSLGYLAAMIQMRAKAASTSHSLLLPPPFILSPTRPDAPSLGIPPPLPISVPTSSPPLLLPSVSRESLSAASTRPARGLRADYGFVATMDREIRRDSKREVGYRITDSWDEIVETLQGVPVSTDTELGRHMTAFETRVIQDTYEIYTRLDDEQSQRQQLAGRLNMLFSDRRAHAYTRHQMETEARLSREAWRRSMDARSWPAESLIHIALPYWADQRRSTEMRELRTTDHTRQQQLIQTLTVMQSLQGHVTTLHVQVATLQGQKMAPKRATRSTPVTTTPAPTTTTTTSVTNAQLQAMIDQGVTAALAARDANKNGDDCHTLRMGSRRTERIFRECTYQDFMKCKPLYFKGTKGVVELIQWFERMETIFCISNCSVENQIKLQSTFPGTSTTADRMFPEKLTRSKGTTRMPDMIHGNIVASNPKTMQEAVEMATELMDKKVITIAERQAENKRKFKNTSETIKTNNNRTRTEPWQGLYSPDPYSAATQFGGVTNWYQEPRGTGSGQKPTCFKCGVQGHFKRECPKLKNNKNRGNQVGNDRAPTKVYVVGHAGTNPDSNIVTGTFLLNNRYASILFNTGADRSFVSTAFSSQMDIGTDI
ncbi:putative reverse transcriptase domain-containing protein [Tanacetum coccineum]